MKNIEFILSLPFILAGLLWQLAVNGFRAGRLLYGMVFPA
jgi:hypothetical protein